jgi:hypothetical protein
MVATVAVDRTVHKRLYTLNGMMWRCELFSRAGRWRWLITWYAVDRYGRGRYVFTGEGDAVTMREAWKQCRRHARIYTNGADILCMNGRVKG